MAEAAPAELACPWCARFEARAAPASRRHTKGQNARYSCPACGCRFTMDVTYMAAAIAREIVRAGVLRG